MLFGTLSTKRHTDFRDHCRNNNYTLVDGLMADMPPGIGPVRVKTVVIEKNDNAEGIVEFAPGPIVGW